MANESSRFISLARWVALAFSLIVAVLPPVGIFFAERSRLQAAMLGELELKTSLIRDIISLDPEFWTFNDTRIEEVLSRSKAYDTLHFQQVTDSSGELVTQHPLEPQETVWPMLTVQADLVDYAHVVGVVTISHSLQLALLETLFTGVLSFLLAFVLYWFFKILPLRLMEEALGKITYLARHDSLTGLANRVRFDEQLSGELDKNNLNGKSVAVLALDLDRFKEVNDTLGHAAGDELLIQVAERLKTNISSTDLPARIGGDEFVVLVPHTGDDDSLLAKGKHLITEISRPYSLSGQSAVIGASVGVALANKPETASPTALMRAADLALYTAKNEGRGICRLFHETMEFEQKKTRNVERALRDALAEDRLVLCYQPQFDATTKRLVGVEALLRFEDAYLTRIGTQDCISIAENTNLIVPISKWVLETACRHATLLTSLQIAVNVSPNLFRWRGLTAYVEERLKAYDLDGSRLEFEITEKVLIDDVDLAVKTLCDLRDLGVGIAMDDFGTGYSSLGYLRQFPFDKIKIDRAFIKDIGVSREADAIVNAIIAMSDALGMKIVAEGVETEQQLRHIQREGDVKVQGYYFGQPMQFGQLLQLVAAEDCKDGIGFQAVGGAS